MDHHSVAEIRLAFSLLRIDPTRNRNDILTAFRNLAKECHPDKFVGVDDKRKTHNRFIELVRARELVFQVIESDIPFDLPEEKIFENENLDRPSDSTEYYNEPFEDESKSKEYEEEWAVFVENEDAYFNLFRTSKAIFDSISHLSASILILMPYLLVFIFLSVVTIGILGTLTPAFLLASFSIPILGWALGIYIIYKSIPKIIKMRSQMVKQMDSSCKELLGIIAKSGYPTTSFKIVIALINLFLIIFCFISPLFIMILIGFDIGFWIIYRQIQQRLYHLDNVFSRIRNSVNSSLILKR